MSRKTNLFVALSVVIVISASVGFYELGLSRGEAAGYQNGFSDGSNSVLIQMQTDVDLQVNQPLYITTLPFNANHVILSYSFFVISNSQNNAVEMYINAPGEPILFSTGYHSNDTGGVKLSTSNIGQLAITFTANPNNTGTVVLEFTGPLRMTFT